MYCHGSKGEKMLLSSENESKQPLLWEAEQGQSMERQAMVRTSRAEKNPFHFSGI